jgi:hypothetical protein
VLLITDDPTIPEPEALIEEARERQRQRAKRRWIVLGVVGFLAVLGFGIDQLALGSTGDALRASASAATPPPTVTYEKVVILKIVPHLPVEKTTIETWSSSTQPAVNRQVVTIAGGPRLEIGAGPAHAKVLGPLQAVYLYDRSTNTIYRTGFFFAPPPSSRPPTPKEMFAETLDRPGVHLAGTRTYDGRSVFVLSVRNPKFGITGTIYADKLTYRPLMSDFRRIDLRNIVRTVAYKTLPATPANLALTRLRGVHPNARIVFHASPHIRALYGEAAFPSGQHSAN